MELFKAVCRSVQFQIVPCSTLYFISRSIGPFQCSHCNYRVSIYCTCHFQSCSLFLVYFGFLCLQVSSVSNFCPDSRWRRRSFIQAHLLNCAAGMEEHSKQISLVGVGSACSVWVSLGLPPLTACVLSLSILLRLQVALLGNFLGWALGCVHFPDLCHSGSGSRVRPKSTDSVGPAFCARVLCPSQVRSAQATRCLASAHSPGVVCLITSPFPAAASPACAAAYQVCYVPLLGS